MFYLGHTKHQAIHTGCNRWLPSKLTQLLALTLAVLGLAGWAASPGYTSSRSAPARSAALGQITPLGINEWTSSGPQDVSILSLAIDPGNPNIIFAGAVGGGLDGSAFKSIDGGASWSRSDTGLTAGVVDSLVIEPSDSNIIYAGTASGVFKSVDGGASWSQSGTSLPHITVSVLAIDPGNPNTIFAGTRDEDRLFKSIDGGASWRRSDTSLTFVGSLVIDPRNTAVIYASGNRLWKSQDGGVTWNLSDDGFDHSDAYYFAALAIDPSNTNILYAVTNVCQNEDSCQALLFKSNDGAASWSRLAGPGNIAVYALAIDPSNTNIIYAGSSKSIDGGESWSDFNVGLTSGVSALVIDPSGTRLHAGTDRGVFNYGYGTPSITNVSVTGKNLLVFGENFDSEAVILLNGEEQRTRNDDQNPKTALIGKKAGKKTKPGDKLQVINHNGTLSEEFTFAG